MIQSITAVIIGIISIIGTIITVVTVINFIKFKVDSLDEREKESKKRQEDTTEELRHVVNRLSVVVAEQAVINKFTTDLLENLNTRMEKFEKSLADHNTMMELFKQLVDQKRK